MNIIQIGVNDAVDELYDFCNKYKYDIDKAVFIDASREALALAKERYKQILEPKVTTFREFAVVDTFDIDKIEFFYPEDEPTFGHNSTIKDMLILEGRINIVSRMVETIEINTLLRAAKEVQFRGNAIDRLYIDTEGTDADLISAIDFNDDRIAPIYFIKFESAHSDGHFKKGPKYQKAIDHLIKNGYTLFEQVLDTFAVLK